MSHRASTDPRRRAELLSVEHNDLDAAIGALFKSAASDDLLITRLKKRKLQIKDEIAALAAPEGLARAS